MTAAAFVVSASGSAPTAAAAATASVAADGSVGGLGTSRRGFLRAPSLRRASAVDGLSADASSNTSTTTVMCELAMTACECANLGVCGWPTDSNGNGDCRPVADATPGVPLVECDFCAAQSHCPGQGCNQLTDACGCALAPQGCRWSLETGVGYCEPLEKNLPTGCNLCPTQARCSIYVPIATHFEPDRDSIQEGGFASVYVRLWFNTAVRWCSNSGLSGTGVYAWCAGLTPESQQLPSSWVSIDDTVLRADITGLIRQLVLNDDKQCGITIDPGIVCTTDTLVPYPGLNKAGYRFTIRDSIPPSLVGFQPVNGESSFALDGEATFVFDEAVNIGRPANAIATLSRLDSGSYGNEVTMLSTMDIRLNANTAAVEGRFLKVRLSGNLQPDTLYTLSLKYGAVADTSGNEFVGLLANAYTFRTTAITARSDANLSSGGGLSVLAVIAIVSAVVVVIGMAVVGFIRLMKGRSWASLEEVPSFARVALKPKRRPAPAVSVPPTLGGAAGGVTAQQRDVAPASPTAQTARSSASSAETTPTSDGGAWAYRMPGRAAAAAAAAAAGGTATAGARAAAAGAAGGKRVQPDGGRAPSTTRPPPRSGAAASPHAAGVGGSAPSASKPPPRQKPAASPGAGAGAANAANTPLRAAAKEDDRCPEVKAVEKQMRDMMNEPLAARKKALKELMLEYHPDKNSAAHATEVFQFINNAKAWFLSGS